jgi:DNA-binding transcriptional regulator of glucitol operon
MKWKILTTDQRMELWFIILVVVGFIAAIILGWLMLR